MDYNELYKRVTTREDGSKGGVEGVIYAMGNQDINMEKFYLSGAGAAVAKMMENTVLNPDEHSPESVAYWAKCGMVKEFHGEDNPMDWAELEARTGFSYDVEKGYEQNRVKKWTSFVPVSAFKKENEGRKYPLMFVLHGAGNVVYTIDGWGYVDVAAEREWIVIAPSIELDDVVLEIYEEAKKLYPVDESRVYVTGFSYGSMNTNILSLQHPDIFAAAAPCGGFMTDGLFRPGPRPKRNVPDTVVRKEEPMRLFDGSKSKAFELKMPVMSVIGNKDGSTYPIDESPAKEDLLRYLNFWSKINGLPEINKSALDEKANRSVAEKLLGISLAPGCSVMKTVDGIDYAIGDFKDESGVTKVRIICEDNVPHWPTPELSRQVVEFFSHFARDVETGESIYIK